MSNDNSNKDSGCSCAHDYIGIGDVVEHRMNTDVFGIVIALEGSLLHVRLSPSLAVVRFHDWELQHLEDDSEPIDDDEADVPDNVVPVDFTKRVRLDKGTKTKGAA